MEEGFTIGSLARQLGVSVETVRYYQRRGLMPLPTRPPAGARRYGSKDIARFRFIRQAQALGFSLDEIASLLELRRGGDACCAVQRMTEGKLRLLRDKLRQIRAMERQLTVLLNACRDDRGGGSRDEHCPLLESLWPTKSDPG